MKNTDDNVVEFEGQDELELTSHPHQMGTDTQLRITKEQSSVFELLRRESRGDLVLAPDFQRTDVWDKKHKSELIESILMGIPIPLIYLFEDEDGVRQIIDGKQRITALKGFLNNEFPLTELSMLPNLKGKRFFDIPLLLQAKLEDYQLHSYVIQPPTPEYVKFNIFERVNRGGVNLNKQEMRHALYQGKATTLIQELAESNEFRLATGDGVKPNRMRDRYLVLRFVSFYLLITGQLTGIKYRSDIDAFLATVMKYLNKQSSLDLIEHAKAVCLLGMKNVYQILGNEAFRFSAKNGGNRRPVNMALFEMLVFSFCYLEHDHVNDEKAKKIVDNWKSEIDERDFFAGSIDTQEQVKLRFELALKITEEIKNA
ncbi:MULTISPECIES: DUF262 domain-containing protein [Aeromonas]|uniref:DUF262 domain-containing protein n=1 Tax=Aeromonas TaxID=642 RepID=UPI0022DE9E48|nr:DUF262 domain-containing protein [Aeromonas sp. QDB63]